MGIIKVKKKDKPNQLELARQGWRGIQVGGFKLLEFQIFDLIKKFRTDILLGTDFFPVKIDAPVTVLQKKFQKLIQRYIVAIFNDYVKFGKAVFALIEGEIYYIANGKYNDEKDKISIKDYPAAPCYEFFDPLFFCGEPTIYDKCKNYIELENIAISSLRNGLLKAGYVSVFTPHSSGGDLAALDFIDDEEKDKIEKDMQTNYGVAGDDQKNIMIMPRPMDVHTIFFDAAKVGVNDTKKIAEEYICGMLGVPYVLLPSSGQTFSNFEEANKILYENNAKWCVSFVNFIESSLGFKFDFRTVGEKDKSL